MNVWLPWIGTWIGIIVGWLILWAAFAIAKKRGWL